MKRKKLVKVLGIALLGVTAMSAISPVAANAAWKKNNTGWWYTEGSSWSVGWRKIDGVWYYFDKSGYMKTGWVNDNGTWYYMQSSGAMKTGWVNDNGTWYYLSSSGAMKTGWLKDGEDWYYLQPSGAMVSDRFYDVNGKTYFFMRNGQMRTGWAPNGEKESCYLKEDGSMAKGWLTIDGETYYFDNDGALQLGKINVDGASYYFNGESGALVKDKNSKYLCTDKDGKITKLDTEGIKNYILENDSEYIDKYKESPHVDDIYFMEPDLSTIGRSTNRDEANYNINNEECIVVHVISVKNNYENEAGMYLIGLESGKIYSLSSNGPNEIYEIKDNKKVETHVDKNTNLIDNWR